MRALNVGTVGRTVDERMPLYYSSAFSQSFSSIMHQMKSMLQFQDTKFKFLMRIFLR